MLRCPLPTVGAPSASNSPSALSAQALRAHALRAGLINIETAALSSQPLQSLVVSLRVMFVKQTGSDACTGDGGGPLLCPLSSDPAKLVQVQPLLYKGATP